MASGNYVSCGPVRSETAEVTPLLINVVKRLENARIQAADFRSSIRSINDRVLGSTPAPPCGPNRPESQGSMSQTIEGLMCDLDTELSGIADELVRLRQIA